MSNVKVTAVYNPITGLIGCVLLQAAVEGSSEVAHLFESKDWELAPRDGQRLLSATMSQWEALAGMSAQERIERWEMKSS